MFSSIDAEKELNKIQYLFTIKTFNKLGIERMDLNINKAIYGKPIANITLNDES